MSARERLVARMASALPRLAAGLVLDDLDAYRAEVLREAARGLREHPENDGSFDYSASLVDEMVGGEL